MESVTLSDEQFKELIGVLRPQMLETPTPPTDEDKNRALAVELLGITSRHKYWGTTDCELSVTVRELAKKYI